VFEKRTIIRMVGVPATVFGLVFAAVTPALASTSNGVVHHAAGEVAGEVWFNSGNHATHSTSHPENGFNSFTFRDDFCGDGWGIGVEWQLADQVFTHQGTADCEPVEVTYETGQATSIVLQFNWRPFMWAVDGLNDTVYGDWQTDWMGSNSTEGDTDLFTRTSVHNDRLGFDDDSSPHTFTATMWPTAQARVVGPGFTPFMWRDLQERTPLPSVLTEDQRESMYKQLYCHALFGRIPELGGATWEIESARPNIAWWRVLLGQGKCNW
jgi:hypothetical protein